MDLRHPTESEQRLVAALVQAVIDEVYGGLWAPPPVPIGVTDWSPAWVAFDRGDPVGVALTSEERIEDLWVAAKLRGSGVGSALLRRCETEIRNREIAFARLRVVSTNITAIRFYERAGWIAEREYPHESLPVRMQDMAKLL